MSAVRWPTEATEALYGGLQELIQAVAALGGAVGWLEVPSAQECRQWVDDRLHDPRTRWVTVTSDDRIVATGRWTWADRAVWRHNAHVFQVMTHPQARGQGHGRTVMEALISDARSAGVESLVLDVRGNNHGAEAMYRSLGFVEAGVLTDFIAVGQDRFDLVTYQLPVGLPAGVRRHARRRQGPGAS